MIRICLLIISLTGVAGTASAEPPIAITAAIDFERDVRPILSSRCLKCHGPDAPKGGLDLTNRSAAIDAGAIDPDDAEQGTLLPRVTSTDESLRMPPDGEPLSSNEVESLRTWSAEGASWPGHWAYDPLTKPEVPAFVDPDDNAWCRTPIDSFILNRLRREGLSPSPEADRLTLIRRASFDLLGLPPTPEEIDAFLNDRSADAWEQCIERMLASPHYGQRQARHWMDLVHFAETHGHDQDRPREHAWPYRDYLIKSFNDDKPYSQFVAEQIAGDAIDPLNPEAITATGFLAAGPWDESSLRDIHEDSVDREIAQYLDRDDIVTTVMSTFASTSVHCARCHDHKFDPITQQEYFGLQAVFAGVDKANRKYDPDPETARLRARLLDEQQRLERQIADAPHSLLTDELRKELIAWEVAQASRKIRWQPINAVTAISHAGASLTIQDDASILATGPRPDKDVYTVEGAVNLPRLTAVRLEVLPHDQLPMRGPGRSDNGNLHLNEFRLFQNLDEASRQRVEQSLAKPHADFNQSDWTIEASLDGNPNTAWGIFPEIAKSHHAVFPLKTAITSNAATSLSVELHQIHGGSHLIGRFRLSATDADVDLLQNVEDVPADISAILETPRDVRTDDQHQTVAIWFLRDRLKQQMDSLPDQQLIYAGTNLFQPDGTFRPASKPRTIHVLRRGLVNQRMEEAVPGALACVNALPGKFDSEDVQDEGIRRVQLAQWLTDPHNPLVWRSIVNRVWQKHFEHGLVDTPNDFGLMGSAPSHPELLDWLAVSLLEQGGSLKSLHRTILQSAVYRQVSDDSQQASQRDAGNRLLWRMNRRRLDAESFRDSLLRVSGTLDPTMGGPSVRQFIQTPGVHVTPVVDYQNFDIDDPANSRHSVYRFLFRTVPDPFMEALDCPDASQLAPKRNVSLTALQALATLNDKFVVRQSERFADSLRNETADLEQQIEIAYRRLIGRPPSAAESEAVAAYAVKHGLANACRFLFNTNEFLFVD
jgi:hypothetical protein